MTVVAAVGACTRGQAADPIVRGPLCELLPSGTDPGSPALLVTEPSDIALTWIPVLTVFEASVRAAGLADDLRGTDAVTALAPTDEAFEEVMTEDTLDELILFRQDELRVLVEQHLIDGSNALTDLLEAGTATSRAGTSIMITADGAQARVADTATTVCADYRTANGRIHVIDAVLGPLPSPAATTQPEG